MPNIQKVLMPVDFSEPWRGASHYGAALARQFNAEITLLHVLPYANFAGGGMEYAPTVLESLAEERRTSAQTQLDTFLAEELQNVKVNRVLLEGDPAGTIVDYAHNEHTNLIVMPTHGYGPFRRFILGSVTAKVLHDADCPVWTGIHMAEAPPVEQIAFQNVACAVDLGPQSRCALKWAAEFAAKFGATLSIFHVTPDLDGRVGEYFDPDWRLQIRTMAKEEIEKLMTETGVTAKVQIISGDVAREVALAAGDHKTDLLVIGRGSSSGILGRLRTHSYALIRQSPCPVVSV
jgi:nucleotide-binding universal stress UspA family protein